jgi:hypothetical protein
MKALRLVVAFLVLAAPAAAQGTDLASRVDAATLRSVQPVLDAAVRDSLPVTALESKVLEGVAKRVPPDRIGSVVRELADEFRGARAVLREGLPGRPIAGGEVVAVALATRQGVAPEVLQALLASSPAGGSMEIAMTVLTELVRRGVPVDEASTVMAHVVRTAVPMHIAAQIPGKVDGAVGSGSRPGAALGQALRTLNIPAPPGRRPNE